ncbi:MAG: endo-1,4-beta-xylanase [Vicinamibacterales bacterium]
MQRVLPRVMVVPLFVVAFMASVLRAAGGDVPFLRDVDGDTRSDLVTWLSQTGTWRWVTSSNWFSDGAAGATQWGSMVAGVPDVPLMGDIDGDGKGDPVVWRPGTGTFHWLTSSSWYDEAAAGSRQWGTVTSGVPDVPLVGDMDGDSEADLLVWRPRVGTFYWLTSSSGYSSGSARSKQWGAVVSGVSDVPLIGDIDGDRKADLIYWRPGTGTFSWLTSSSGYSSRSAGAKKWGSVVAGVPDVPLIGDIDGDRKADLIYWRPGTGTFAWLTSSSGYSSRSSGAKKWGSVVAGVADVPLIGDIDGDGKGDLAFVRPGTGEFHWLTSSSGFAASVAGAYYQPTQNQPPGVSAGPGQTITLPASATLNGTTTDDGLPAGSTLTQTWSRVSGPGTVVFGDVTARSTAAAFSAAGTYVLRLTATDSTLTTTADVTILVGAATTPCDPPAPLPTELLLNAGFETMSGGYATNWTENHWGGATVNFALAPGRSSSKAQRLTVAGVTADAGVIVAQPFTFKSGITYEGRIWLRSPDSPTVLFHFRRQGPWYESKAAQRVTLTPAWQEFVIRGGWHDQVPGYFGLSFLTSGTVEADDASLRELASTDCIANTAPLATTFTGMTINKWGTYNTWPGAEGFGLLRLWDTGTRWEDLEPVKGAWDWRRMDYYVDAAQAANQGILYTLGMTPLWASARPGDADRAEPANLNDWRNYVRTVALRYRGRVKYWELWNEVDYSGFFTGSVDNMVELTRAAREELKAVDPANVVLAPNITANGFPWLDEFLSKGGGDYIDIVSWHLYTDYRPELDEPEAAGLRDVLARHGLSSLAIWNTEGSINGAPVSDAAAAGSIARAYLVQPWWGHSNFSFYAWDIDFGNPLSQPGYVAPTTAGVAYREVAGWLSGATMLSRARTSNGTWQVTIRLKDGSTGYAVWNDGNTTFTLPAAWAATTQRDLAGGSKAIVARTVGVGPAPILLVP